MLAWSFISLPSFRQKKNARRNGAKSLDSDSRKWESLVATREGLPEFVSGAFLFLPVRSPSAFVKPSAASLTGPQAGKTQSVDKVLPKFLHQSRKFVVQKTHERHAVVC